MDNVAQNQVNTEKEMSFIDHLEELRWHIIRALAAIMIVTVVVFMLGSFIFDKIIFGPKHDGFLTYQIFCDIFQFFQIDKSRCFGPAKYNIQNIEMAGQFLTHIKVSLILGFITAFPYVLWEMWKFIRPGLYENEQKYTRGLVFYASTLFFIGVSFGYFILAPFSLNFFARYQVTPEVENIISLTSYISVISTVVLAAGIMFELPMVVYLLSKIGIVTPDMMRSYRKHAFIAILLVAAIITPADVWTQILVTIPVYFLYEMSILISARVYKQYLATMAKEELSTASDGS